MKHTLALALLLAPPLAACGGGNPPPPATTAMPLPPEPQPTPQEEPIAEPTPPPEPTHPPEAEVPPVTPPPTMFAAQAELEPVRGEKMSPVVVKFQQEEGKATRAIAETSFEGLRPGKYHLVVHEAAECGPNATKAGKVWEQTASVPMTVEVTKDTPATVDEADLALQLEGDQAITGRTLVLHADRRGKPGKPVACGAIAKLDVEEPPTTGSIEPQPVD